MACPTGVGFSPLKLNDLAPLFTCLLAISPSSLEKRLCRRSARVFVSSSSP